MTTVSMDLVKQLRDKTQIGMMDCKKALEEAQGDFDKAVELLRKKGAAVAAKRADNMTNHGRVESFISDDCKTAALVETACETDFSANTEAMKEFTVTIARNLAHKNAASVEEIFAQPLLGDSKGMSLQHALDDLIAKICEKIKINRFARFQVAGNGMVNVYIHPGSSVGVMVELQTNNDASAHLEALKQVAKDVCMQAAVTNPVCVRPEEMDQTTLEAERRLATEQMQTSGKPANVIEKIVEGKIAKFYQDACLLNQPFIKNDKQTMQQYVDEAGKNLGLSITVKQFKRFAIGR